MAAADFTQTLPSDTAKAIDVIVVSMAGVGVLALINNATADTTRTPGLRVAVGLFASTFILTATAEFQPQLAAGVAVLALTTAAFVYGGPAWAAVTKVTKPSKGKIIK